MTRSADLQSFIDALGDVLLAQRSTYTGRHVAELVLADLKTIGDQRAEHSASALTVLAHVETALGTAQPRQHSLRAVSEAFGRIQTKLAWRQRQVVDPTASPGFSENHANAVIIGKGGLEENSTYTIGVSVAAPYAAYPEHDHPPEELYLLLSPGDFRHGNDPWNSLKAGDTFYNTPAINHAMRAGDEPLLVIWIFGRLSA